MSRDHDLSVLQRPDGGLRLLNVDARTLHETHRCTRHSAGACRSESGKQRTDRNQTDSRRDH